MDALKAEDKSLHQQLDAARDPRPGGGPGVDWEGMTTGQRREWLARYIAKVEVYPTRRGRTRGRFNRDAVRIIPGPWWDTLTAAPWRQHPHPGYPEPPAARAAATAPAPTIRIRVPRLCDLPGCGEPHSAHGLCGMHAQRQRLAARRAGVPAGELPAGAWDQSPGPVPGYETRVRPTLGTAAG